MVEHAECALLLCRKSLKERRTARVAHSKLDRFVGVLHHVCASCMLILRLGSRWRIRRIRRFGSLVGVVLEKDTSSARAWLRIRSLVKERVYSECRVARHCNVQLRSWMTILALPSEKRGKGLTKIVWRKDCFDSSLHFLWCPLFDPFLHPIVKNKVRRMKRSTRSSSNATISDTGYRRCFAEVRCSLHDPPGYKMSKEELQGMADKMGIQLNNLCYLKQAGCESLAMSWDVYRHQVFDNPTSHNIA